MSRYPSICVLLAVVSAGQLTAQEKLVETPREIEVQSVVVRLLDEAVVPAQEAGMLVSLLVREGSQVQRGDLLGQIDDRVSRVAGRAAKLEMQVAQAKAENDVKQRFAAKALEVARAELKRSTESIRRFPKSVSQSQLDVEKLTVERTELDLEQAKHEAELNLLEVKLKEQAVAAATLQIARRRILAPFSGTVVETHIRPGEWLEPGQPALRMVSIDRLKVEGFIHVDRLLTELSDASVRLTTAGDVPLADGGQELARGEVRFVSPEVDPITGQVRIWAEVDNAQRRLRPGQRARMWVVPDPDAAERLAEFQQ